MPCLIGVIGSTARMPKRHGERLLDDAVLALDTAARTDFAHGDGAGALPRAAVAGVLARALAGCERKDARQRWALLYATCVPRCA